MAEGGVEAARDRLEKPVPKAMVTEGGLSFLETPEGRRLAYHKSDGSSPGVVFVHGLCSTMDEKKARAVEAHCRSRGTAFVRFDLSGHGASSGDLKGSDMSMWLEDLTAVLASLTTGPQVLVGSDVGGWLMFLVTMRNPDRVAGLVGVSVAPDFTQELWKGLDKETRQEAKKTGVYRLASPDDGAEPYEISMRLIQDGSKYTILDMPGAGLRDEHVVSSLPLSCIIITPTSITIRWRPSYWEHEVGD